MPYRVDVADGSDRALDRLIELGALDVERSPAGGLAALMPERVTPEEIRLALGVSSVDISEAVGRDADSVWVLSPRTIEIGGVRIVPAHGDPAPRTVRLLDGQAFGTGLHPTTGLCLEILNDSVENRVPEAVMDVGTGSGVLALAALTLGVPRALGVDVDRSALEAAAGNARLNGLEARLQLVHGGPEAAAGTWPLVLANVLAAPLIEMAPLLVRRVGHHGDLILSGIPSSLEPEVERTYRRLGMRRLDSRSRGGWTALVLQATW